MNFLTFIIVMLVGSLVAFSYIDQQDMRVCELSHSHDVCFTTLNR